mmetsp:Transcript_38395/g.67505  ORF Transcript_38395/g.67505 Transcript_38395/m.67505 type:complete len:147 (+) Transcript_38395:228-668(+)
MQSLLLLFTLFLPRLKVICVLEYRRLGKMSHGCVCNPARKDAGGESTPQHARRAHVMNSRRQRAARKVSLAEVPPETISRLDSITKVDAQVYRAAVVRVLCDIQAVERATGNKVLCSPRMEQVRNLSFHIPNLWRTFSSYSLPRWL